MGGIPSIPGPQFVKRLDKWVQGELRMAGLLQAREWTLEECEKRYKIYHIAFCRFMASTALCQPLLSQIEREYEARIAHLKAKARASHEIMAICGAAERKNHQVVSHIESAVQQEKRKLEEKQDQHRKAVTNIQTECRNIEIQIALQSEVIDVLSSERKSLLEGLKGFDMQERELTEQKWQQQEEIKVLRETQEELQARLEELKGSSEGAITTEVHLMEMAKLDSQIEERDATIDDIKTRILKLEKVLGDGARKQLSVPPDGALFNAWKVPDVPEDPDDAAAETLPGQERVKSRIGKRGGLDIVTVALEGHGK